MRTTTPTIAAFAAILATALGATFLPTTASAFSMHPGGGSSMVHPGGSGMHTSGGAGGHDHWGHVWRGGWGYGPVYYACPYGERRLYAGLCVPYPRVFAPY